MTAKLPRTRSRSAARAASESPPAARYEAEVLKGLSPFAEKELRVLNAFELTAPRPEAIGFGYAGSVAALSDLRFIVAVYRLLHFEVPRPKALLGHEHFRRLLRAIAENQASHTFRGFRLSAAGRDSSVFTRLSGALERETGLKHDPDEGELLLRVRPAVAGPGWEVLLRLTPRPLSARPWRVCNMAGGLNATVAAAMNALAGVSPRDRYLNAMCGSGTLLIERRSVALAGLLAGCDVSEDALGCARENLEASGFAGEVGLEHRDATALSYETGSFDVVTADLPWGDAVGSRSENAQLYPTFLDEIARVTTQDARLVLLTHDLKLFEATLRRQQIWQATKVLQVYHGGHYPKLYLLRKSR